MVVSKTEATGDLYENRVVTWLSVDPSNKKKYICMYSTAGLEQVDLACALMMN
jgi:hypothetical protein